MENNTGNSNKLNPMIIVGVIIALVVVAGVFVLGRGNFSQENVTQNQNDSAAGETMLAGEGGNDDSGLIGGDAAPLDERSGGSLNTIEVEGGGFYYEPNEIRVKKGMPVKIIFNSVDMMHDFVIDELNVKTKIIKAGETTEVEFIPNETGEFAFYCSVGNHRAQGMVGTLIVE